MGIVRYIDLDQLSAKDKRELKKMLQKQKKALQEAINLAETSLKALAKKRKSRKTAKQPPAGG